MIYRVSDALEEIAEYVNGAGVDLCNSESRDRAIKELNRATRHLMREGDWDGMEQEIVIPLDGQQLVLDDRIETIRLAKWRGGEPLRIYSDAFKYLEGGFGEAASGKPIGSMIDLGDGYPTHRSLHRAMPIMAYSDKKEDEGAVLEVRGTDANGKEYLFRLPVRHHLLGDKPPAYTGPSCDYWTTGRFKDIAELRKPRTNGLVHVYGYDPADGQLCWLTTLRRETTSPCHRRYEIPGAVQGSEIIAQVSMRYYPVHFDDEPLLIQNLDALAIMVQALDKRDKGDMASYTALRNSAVSQLKKQLRKKHGGEKSGLQVRVPHTLTAGNTYSHRGLSARRGGGGQGLPTEELVIVQGERGLPGASAPDPWLPILIPVEDGDRIVHKVDWFGGTGAKPATKYIGPNGYTDDISQATDIKGDPGEPGEDASSNLGAFTASADLGSNRWVAQKTDGTLEYADGPSGKEAIGMIFESVVTGGTTTVYNGGKRGGFSGLTVGPLFLGANGLSTSTAPSSGISQPVGYAKSATELFIDIEESTTL